MEGNKHNEVMNEEAEFYKFYKTCNWLTIRQNYEALRKMSVVISENLGTLITVFLLEFVFYFAVGFDEMFDFTNSDWSLIGNMLFWFIESCGILYFAADACHKVSVVTDWFRVMEQAKYIPNFEFYLIMNEVQSNSVAIKGSNVYPITYSFVASVRFL